MKVKDLKFEKIKCDLIEIQDHSTSTRNRGYMVRLYIDSLECRYEIPFGKELGITEKLAEINCGDSFLADFDLEGHNSYWRILFIKITKIYPKEK